jgi:hypothetical protein
MAASHPASGSHHRLAAGALLRCPRSPAMTPSAAHGAVRDVSQVERR